MTLQLMLAWWNLLYIVPFGLAVFYLILYSASGITFGDADADHDFASAEAHGDLGHDADGGDHDISDPHHDVGHDSDSDHDAPSTPWRAALTWLGVGRVPLSVLLMVLLLVWGTGGFLTNQLAGPAFAIDWQVVLLSIPVALIVSVCVTGLVVRAIERWLPLDETSARRRHDLLGLTGTAMLPISAKFGMISVRDDRGELHQVPCRVTGEHANIPKAGQAVLVAFNAKERLFHVIPPSAVGRANTGE